VIRRILAALALLSSITALSGCIQIAGTFPAQQGSEPAASAPAAASDRPVTHGVVGEELSAGAWTVTVEGAKRTAEKVAGAKPAAGSEFLTVDVGFENKGSDALEVRAEDFQLTDPSGTVVPQAIISKAAYNARSMRPLLARFGTSTVFVYQVPKGLGRYTFVFSPQGLGKKTRLEWQVP
jgi:hypothetical protein